VHLNLAVREPLVPRVDGGGTADTADGRAENMPWTRFCADLELPWAERGLIVCGDGDYPTGQLLELAEIAGWPVLAEPSSDARRGPNALSAYQYLLGDEQFTAAHRPDVIVSAGRPGLSRAQFALLRASAARHVVVAQGPGRWADPARTATDVAAAIRLAGRGTGGSWLTSWRQADHAVRSGVDAALEVDDALSEPRLARDLAAALPEGSLLWAASSLPIRDLDHHMAPRSGLRVLANRGASGIDGLVSAAIGAALAHQAAAGGSAAALLGDLAMLHDAPGLFLGPDERRPDLWLIVANNDGGGIFSLLEQASFPGPFERVFGTPHGTDLAALAAAAGIAYRRVGTAGELADEFGAPRPAGVRLIEVRTDRTDQAALRAELAKAAARALDRIGRR
jgi:2-succinyl-5-enolpyruvyl-6-hydroxy-3-cyclohexene-1-carboxylate synthase